MPLAPYTVLESLLLQPQDESLTLRGANEVLGAKIPTMDKMHTMPVASCPSGLSSHS